MLLAQVVFLRPRHNRSGNLTLSLARYAYWEYRTTRRSTDVRGGELERMQSEHQHSLSLSANDSDISTLVSTPQAESDRAPERKTRGRSAQTLSSRSTATTRASQQQRDVVGP